jgi:hypothetical protein
MNFKNILIISVLILFCACKKENRCDCFKRTGAITTELRSTPSFTKLIVDQNINVFITQDSVSEIKVEGGENIIPLIKTDVENGVLVLENKNRCNWARSYDKPLNVYLKVPQLESIIANGTGDIKSLNTLNFPKIAIQIKNSGNMQLDVNSSEITSYIASSGDLTLSGVASTHNCNVNKRAFLYCQNLQTSITNIESHTLGLCYVNVANSFICKMDDEGDVYCYGNPITISKDIKGQGQLFIQ